MDVERIQLLPMAGFSWTTGFVLFSLRIAVFVDVFFRRVAWCSLGLRSTKDMNG
jgi:uncharacterized membrane protein